MSPQMDTNIYGAARVSARPLGAPFWDTQSEPSAYIEFTALIGDHASSSFENAACTYVHLPRPVSCLG